MAQRGQKEPREREREAGAAAGARLCILKSESLYPLLFLSRVEEKMKIGLVRREGRGESGKSRNEGWEELGV